MTKDQLNSTFDRFLSENNGKFIERLDSNALNQCFDLAIYFCEYLGFPKTIFSGLYGAHEIFDNWSNPAFEKIPNSATFVPIKGDIAVWKGSLNGGIGHVSVATGEGDTNHFKSFDQNWVVGSPSVIVNHDYSYFAGVQRLKVTNSPSGGTGGSVDNRGAVYDVIANGFPDRLKVNGDTHSATVKQGTDFVAWVKDNVERAGKYDLIKDKQVISDADKQKLRNEGRVDAIKQIQALVNGVK